jgi:hypothetical protein
MNVFMREPMIANATTPKFAMGGRGMNWVMIGIPERPMPRRTNASMYLSVIQSKTAPKSV